MPRSSIPRIKNRFHLSGVLLWLKMRFQCRSGSGFIQESIFQILQIHSRKMNVHPDVNIEELARSTDDCNGAQLKAVCVEAGMLALRCDATEVLFLSECLNS